MGGETIHTRRTSKPTSKRNIPSYSFRFSPLYSLLPHPSSFISLLHPNCSPAGPTRQPHPSFITPPPTPSPTSLLPPCLSPASSSPALLPLSSLPRSTTARRRGARRGRAGGGQRWGAPGAGRWRRQRPWGSTPLSLAPPLLSPPQLRRRRQCSARSG
jgi:hypothetical protein